MTDSREILRLGAGNFANIYVWQSRNCVAIKTAIDPRHSSELQEEFESHSKVHAAADAEGLFRVPKPLRYYPDFPEQLRIDPSALRGGRCAYTMQRVWPIPAQLAASIRANFFPPSHAGDRRAFVARIYLGQRSERPRQSRFFNANNFPLDAARCEQLQLPVGLIAESMGKLLARIHYCAGLDGRDIEFVLGGGKYTQHGFFCFDFNECKPHGNNIENLVSSFFDNDPYYPRPGMRYWDEFKQGYAGAASLQNKEMAKLFVDEVELAVARKVATQPPEGRGNEMALLEGGCQRQFQSLLVLHE